MAKDFCERCATATERTPKLDIAARAYGGFLCDECLTGYQAVIHKGIPEGPREPIDRMFAEAAAAGFKPLTDEQAEAMRQKLRGVSAAMHGGRR